ncbi:hypothetical protein KC640_00570, partial [Candidatus Dojkabacteria bacterium]|nr:hypothetical protein [Candidatus Dojkabacteria bacterium]
MNIDIPTQQIIIRTADLIDKGILTEENIDNLSKEDIEHIMLQLGLTPDGNGLFLIIALFGSTHSKANWRDVFEHEYDLPVFDPKYTGEGWEKWYSKIEALFMEIAKVIVLGLHNGVSENDPMLEGSMGSLLESTMTLLLAYIRGQKVVLYEELNFIDSMDSPSSIILYLIKEFAWETMRQLDPEDVYLVHSKEEAARKAAEVAQEKVNPQIVQSQEPRSEGKIVIVGSGWSNFSDNQIVGNLPREEVVDMRKDDDGQWERAYQLAGNYLTAEPEQKLELQRQLKAIIGGLETN